MYIDPKVKKSMETYARASEIIPGKTQLASRRASSYASGVSPVYAKSSSGARFIDIDGNTFLDWKNAYGAIILGHSNPVVNQAVKTQIDQGSLFTINSDLEVELAELLIENIPSAEMVRYTKGGGEACALAARIARGTTGRDKILFSGYHGWHAWYQAANYLADPITGGYPVTGVEPIGVPKSLKGTAIPFAHEDISMVKNLLNQHKNEIAAIFVEPMMSQEPDKEYLVQLKKLAKEHGCILIFDEVSCGWRIAVGGAQEYIGVTPDMTVLAKGISNGYAMGAVVGSVAAMEPANHMFISSSYWSDNIGLIASITTINELINRNSKEKFKQIGESLIKTINNAIDEVGIAAKVEGVYTYPTLQFMIDDQELSQNINTLFIQEMAKRGIFTPTSLNATLDHTEKDIEITGVAAAESFRVIMKALEGDLDKYLLADTKKEPFRRIVN